MSKHLISAVVFLIMPEIKTIIMDFMISGHAGFVVIVKYIGELSHVAMERQRAVIIVSRKEQK